MLKKRNGKIMKMKLNNKGSILQIVLMTFLIMIVSLTTCFSLLNFHAKHYQMIQQLMKQKNLEIYLVRYYVETIKNDILLSESYEDDEYEIDCYVDDLSSYYEITTHIQSRDFQYSFLVQIHQENYQVLKLEYLEE